MGSGKWSDSDWKSYATTNSHDIKTTKDIFTSSRMKDHLDPKDKFRESVDSDDNPQSTPIVIGLDVTASMNGVSDKIVRESLNKVILDIHERKPVTDPHILMAGIGDVECDSSPLQVTQFEADIKLASQLTSIWLENGGGGNMFESYSLLWYWAATRTRTDSFRKRNKKGFVFTMGDEWPNPLLGADKIERVLGGERLSHDLTLDEILTLASREWEIFHLVITEGSYLDRPMVNHNFGLKGWSEVLGQRALKVTDYRKIPEIICSTMQIVAGQDAEEVAESWDGSTSVVVREATKALSNVNAGGGIVTL